MKPRNPGGFTIVELLVVVAIIALLVGLLLPAVNRARATARQTQCINNQKQIGTAVQTYYTSKGRMPDYLSVARRVNNQPVDAFGWVHPLLPNMGQMNLYDQILDAVVPQGSGQPQSVSSVGLYLDLLVCPADPPTNTEAAAVSYAPNAGRDPTERFSDADNRAPEDWPENGVFGRSISLPPNAGRPPTKNSIEQINRGDGTSRTLMISENVRLTVWNLTIHDDHLHPFNQGIFWKGNDDKVLERPISIVASDGLEIGEDSSAFLTTPSSKHVGGFIATFCDGHTEYVNDQITYSLFARLMSSHGALARQPGQEVRELAVNQATNKPIPNPDWQGILINESELK